MASLAIATALRLPAMLICKCIGMCNMQPQLAIDADKSEFARTHMDFNGHALVHQGLL